MGPIEVPSISGSRYVLLFVDDRSRFKHSFILKKKSEAFGCFTVDKALVERETGRRIGKLRTDGGGEYTLSEFLTYLHEEGIVKHTTTPHTPQSNGVSEWANRMIIETAKAMMFAAGALKEYWAEAITMAVYLRNLTPTRSIKEGSPFEAWHGRWQNLAHLRVWGCIAYTRVPKETRRKLDANLPKCVFVGYTATTKQYNLYDHVNKKVTLSRDVEFKERRSYFRLQYPETAPSGRVFYYVPCERVAKVAPPKAAGPTHQTQVPVEMAVRCLRLPHRELQGMWSFRQGHWSGL